MKPLQSTVASIRSSASPTFKPCTVLLVSPEHPSRPLSSGIRMLSAVRISEFKFPSQGLCCNSLEQTYSVHGSIVGGLWCRRSWYNKIHKLCEDNQTLCRGFKVSGCPPLPPRQLSASKALGLRARGAGPDPLQNHRPGSPMCTKGSQGSRTPTPGSGTSDVHSSIPEASFAQKKASHHRYHQFCSLVPSSTAALG